MSRSDHPDPDTQDRSEAVRDDLYERLAPHRQDYERLADADLPLSPLARAALAFIREYDGQEDDS